MVKKVLLGMMAFATLFATSCTNELDPVESGNTSTVSFKVETPAIESRAYSDGTTATVLQYAVYDAKGQLLDDLTKSLIKENAETINGSTTITLRLTTGDTYQVVFWAAAQNAPYSVDFSEELENAKMTVSYTDAVSNDENRDAFYKYHTFEVKGAQTETIELKRPFAQLNIGTADYAASTSAGYTPDNSAVTIKNIYNTLNFKDVEGKVGSVSGKVEVPFGLAKIKKDEKFPVDGYEYLAMNYLLVDTDQETIEVTYTYQEGEGENADAKTRTVGSVPVQRNYRTNIYGNLLTSEVDINIEIKPEYEKPDYLEYVWDGSEVKEPKKKEDNDNIYEIEYASELAWLAAAVNGTLTEEYSRATVAANDFKDKTFVLTKDIDLGGKEWTPIGSNGKIFKGILDGKGHTVKNLVIGQYENTKKNSNAGLFGVTHDGEIKNLVVENAKVSGRLNVGVVAGQPYTSKYTNITVKGHVEVEGMAYVGGVGGKNAYADWTDITVEADETSYVKAHSIENGTAYRTYVGGVVGFNGEGGHKFSNITSNINVEGSTCDVGGLFGIAHYGNQFENCVCTGNVEIYAAEEADEAQQIGGVAGVWHNGGQDVIFTNCSFTGTLKTNIANIDYYYGGFVGAPYNATGTGKLIIDGKQYVATAAELQAALNEATVESTIYLGYDIVGDVTVVQKQGVKIKIEGEGKKFNGSIKVHSNSNHYADAALTIKDVNFETSTASVNIIEALENGAERYSANITVDNCTFTATGEAVNTSVGVQIKSSKNAKVLNCTATDMHSLIQAQSCDETVVVNGCTINGKNGVAFKQVKAAKVESTTITALEYGIRFDGNTDNYGIVVKDNNVTANQPLIVRKMTGANNTITLEGTNTLTTEAEYQIVITNGSDDAEYVKPTGTYELTGADNYLVYPRDYYTPVASWEEFTAALAVGDQKIKLTDNITYSGNYSLKNNIILDLDGKSITMPLFYVFSTSTIKNGTINGKMYARTGCKVTLEGLTYSGTISDDLSTEGHLQVQGGCDVYAKKCTFAATTVNGSQTRSLSIEASSSGIRKFEDCDFKFLSWGNGSGKYKKNVYVNTMSGTTTVDFTNCKLNGKAPNILFAGTYSLTNLTMSGCDNTSPTLETNRAKDAITEAEWAHISSLIANNKFTQVRLFYAGGSSEYIQK